MIYGWQIKWQTILLQGNMTYIHEGVEVQLTGRVAERKMTNSTAELVEITPVDKDVGSWKKWVSKKSLFDVKEIP